MNTNLITDIKPENIVFTRLPDGFNPDLEVKLIDFGTGTFSWRKAWIHQGTNHARSIPCKQQMA